MMESGRKIDGESLKGEMSFPFQIARTYPPEQEFSKSRNSKTDESI